MPKLAQQHKPLSWDQKGTTMMCSGMSESKLETEIRNNLDFSPALVDLPHGSLATSSGKSFMSEGHQEGNLRRMLERKGKERKGAVGLTVRWEEVRAGEDREGN